MPVIEVKVPDIGDYTDVPVIEILVSPGDTVAPEDALLTLESDKATMEVEAVDEGVVGQILVAVGTEGVSVNKPIAVLLEEGESADDVLAKYGGSGDGAATEAA